MKSKMIGDNSKHRYNHVYGSICGNKASSESWMQDNRGPHLHLQNQDAEMKNTHNCVVVDQHISSELVVIVTSSDCIQTSNKQ